MKNKHLIILGFLFIFFSMWIATDVHANLITEYNFTKISYTPNVKIPIKVTGATGTVYDFAGTNVIEGGDFLAAYIVAIYQYGAGFAGIVAMFILVIASWRWLFAAGNSQKISGAKDMINGVLIGLALLFGGQLLLRQISEDFNSIQSLKIEPPLAALQAISDYEDYTDAQLEELCAELDSCSDYNQSQCEIDPCNIKGDKVKGAVGDFSDACIEKQGFVSHSYIGCKACPWYGKCSQYTDAWHIKEDICDFDGDGLGGSINDPDGCCKDDDENGICDHNEGKD